MAGWTPLQYLFKATYSGTIGTEEIFVYSRWVTCNTDVAETVLADIVNNVAVFLDRSSVAPPVTDNRQGWPSHVVWTKVKVSPWDPIANALKAGRFPVEEAISEAGTGSTFSGLPYQNAIAVTTRSALGGRRKYNRFYLPVPVVPMTDGHGVLLPNFAASVANGVEEEIQTNATDGATVFVNFNHGVAHTVPTSAQYCYAIEDVYLGHRLDTIRRRRNQAPEGRTTVPITGP